MSNILKKKEKNEKEINFLGQSRELLWADYIKKEKMWIWYTPALIIQGAVIKTSDRSRAVIIQVQYNYSRGSDY